jgi:glycosyltransferase involved in cell wall biosynthesis
LVQEQSSAGTRLIAMAPATSDTTPKITICICTRDRPTELRRALDSILESTIRPNQVIVSDDGSEPDTAASVAEHPLAITYTEGPRTGLGANRNHAVSMATGDLLLFLDDDGTLGETFLEKAKGALAELDPEEQPKVIVTGADIEAGHLVVPNEQGLLGFQSRSYRPGEPLRTVVINAALFPRHVFDSIRFDTNLQYGFDEVDITTQAVARGYRIVPCFEAINFHFPSSQGRGDYRPLANASRLYVTLKRRRWTEGSFLRGWGGFIFAAAHLFAASARRSGLTGIGEARKVVAQARSYHAAFLTSRDTASR